MNKTLVLTSPFLHGPVIRDCQYLLRHNRFDDFKPGKRDGTYGKVTAEATKRAKFWLGYKKTGVNRRFGPDLYKYLRGTKRLSPFMRARRKSRIAHAQKASTIKQKALALALTQVGTHESPWGSNSVKYASWYGLNGYPWCAMFVTWCFVNAGDKRIFHRGSVTAYAYWPEDAARAGGHPLLKITHDPEPGDLVVYHHGQGHIGIFRRWTNRSNGSFQAVEGNTSRGGSQDNGGSVLVRDRTTSWVRTTFVKVGI